MESLLPTKPGKYGEATLYILVFYAAAFAMGILLGWFDPRLTQFSNILLIGIIQYIFFFRAPRMTWGIRGVHSVNCDLGFTFLVLLVGLDGGSDLMSKGASDWFLLHPLSLYIAVWMKGPRLLEIQNQQRLFLPQPQRLLKPLSKDGDE